MGVKAAGGIRTLQDAQAMIEAGANRLGASASVRLCLRQPVTDVWPKLPRRGDAPAAVTYAAWHTLEGYRDEQFVMVPHVPAWLCDVCGAKILDADVMRGSCRSWDRRPIRTKMPAVVPPP